MCVCVCAAGWKGLAAGVGAAGWKKVGCWCRCCGLERAGLLECIGWLDRCVADGRKGLKLIGIEGIVGGSCLAVAAGGGGGVVCVGAGGVACAGAGGVACAGAGGVACAHEICLLRFFG